MAFLAIKVEKKRFNKVICLKKESKLVEFIGISCVFSRIQDKELTNIWLKKYLFYRILKIQIKNILKILI
jgi:hypothetical protein